MAVRTGVSLELDKPGLRSGPYMQVWVSFVGSFSFSILIYIMKMIIVPTSKRKIIS